MSVVKRANTAFFSSSNPKPTKRTPFSTNSVATRSTSSAIEEMETSLLSIQAASGIQSVWSPTAGAKKCGSTVVTATVTKTNLLATVAVVKSAAGHTAVRPVANVTLAVVVVKDKFF